MGQLIVAIDGFSACGKSTLAKELARRLNLIYIDTGAMYRAVTLFFIQENIDINTIASVKNALSRIEISFKNLNHENTCFLNEVNIEKEIRSKEVSDKVSDVAAISAVRTKLVAMQRDMGKSMNVVMDGRDIGTVVYPNADFKFFLKAEEMIRVERRLKEFRSKEINITEEEVLSNLRKRDHIDSNRKDSPLMVAEDAIIIDNSYLNRTEQIELVCKIIAIRNR